MAKGFDCTADTTPHIPAIKAAGYTFVARYMSHSPWKDVTRKEALALTAAGIYLVSVWESAGDHESFFTYAQGQKDGEAAYAYAKMIGQPTTAPIYFAVDADLSCASGQPSHTEGVYAYFAGVRNALQVHGTMGVHTYHCGVYGSGHVCSVLKSAGMVTHTWLAQSPGWSGHDYAEWNIKQAMGTHFAGIEIDPDISAPSGGGGFFVK